MTVQYHAPYANYALRAARGFLASMAHYGQKYVPASDGRIATPAYFRNMLGTAVHMLGDYDELSAAAEAATQRDGHAFYVWNLYAEALIARLGRTIG